MTKIRLILADDHPLIREGFKSLLGQNSHFELLGEAQNGRELIEMVKELEPDVVLADIKMPLGSGLDALKTLLPDFPNIRFIMLTMHDEAEYIVNALKNGASGYLLKSVELPELEKAIQTVYEGGKYLSPHISSILAETVVKTDEPEDAEITPREKEVLGMVAAGMSTKIIADKLGISIRTVETHRINMLKKLKVSNSAELIKKAIELRLIQL